MTLSLGNVKKSSGSHFSTIFFEIIAHFKNQSRYASGFYNVKGICELFILKSTKPLPIIFKVR